MRAWPFLGALLLVAGVVTPSRVAARTVAVKKTPALAPPELGPADAPVVVERFCDLTQPQCARLDGALAELAGRHPERLRIIYRMLPLRRIAVSETLAEAAYEAHAQGRFFAFRDVVYAASSAERRDVDKLAARAGLDVARLDAALADGRHRARLDDDAAWAARFDIESVPQLVWNGRRADGFDFTVDGLETAYDRAYALAEDRLNDGVPADRLYPTLLKESIRARASAVAAAEPGERSGRSAASHGDTRLTVPIEGAPARGPADAPVTIVVFGDYQCGHCRALQKTLTRLEELYPSALRIVWKHAPLDSHPDAIDGARAAACAQRQGKFWEYHQRLYAQPYRLERTRLIDHAAKLGLDVEQFAADFDGGACDARVRADLADAKALGLAGQTPVIVVNGIVLVGNRPEGELRAVIDAELAPGVLKELTSAAPPPSAK